MHEKLNREVLWWFISLFLFVGLLFLLIKLNIIDYSLLKLLLVFPNVDWILLGQKLLITTILFFIFGILLKIIQYVLILKYANPKVSQERFGFLKIVSFVWWTLFVIIILSLFLNNIGTVLTSLGLIGFALTFALQKPILNFVGWIVINFKSIYKVGDRIEIGSIRGDVKEIAVMNTVLDAIIPGGNTRAYKTVTFPNELVLTSDVINYTKDSNYILDNLIITVTYESNYEDARDLLDKTITKIILENRKDYQKTIETKTKEIEELIKKSTKLLKSRINKKEEIQVEKEIQEHKENLEFTQKQMEVLDEEFIPKVRIELQDSAIALEAFYLVPYTMVKNTRTKINTRFLNEIAKNKNIEVAYPHMQIVYDKNK